MSTAFLDAYISVDPKTVQYVGASVTVVLFPEQTIPLGGNIKLVVPDEIETFVDGIDCFDVSLSSFVLPIMQSSHRPFIQANNAQCQTLRTHSPLLWATKLSLESNFNS